LARSRALRLLARIQPTTGGYLEATPLTSFVVMSLVGAGLADHPVVSHGIEFLVRSARPDGSWAIDTNLATWVTTLAVNALAIDPEFEQIVPKDERRAIRDWLLDQQYTKEHPYTLAAPGCWAWTDLSGGVPDADDTAGAILALKNLGLIDPRTKRAAAMGVRWLVDLQNRDGGIPTFCRGWGKLPFDRSGTDITAHAVRAWAAWTDELPDDRASKTRRSADEALYYLRRNLPIPLWFGNQHAPNDENMTYGAARVQIAAAATAYPHTGNGYSRWLIRNQRPDGGWGAGGDTPASIEETALALEALASPPLPSMILGNISAEEIDSAISRGVAWLIEHTHRGTQFDPTPIGFYFAKLWYFEKFYPLIFTVAALNAVKHGGDNKSFGTDKQ